MKGRTGDRIGEIFSLTIIVFFLFCSPVYSVAGEKEDGSLDMASILGEEWVSGNVTYDWDNISQLDRDFYKVYLPEHHAAVITLKKLDIQSMNNIYGISYDEFRERRNMFSEIQSSIVVQIPGSETRGVVFGSEEESHFYIEVRGNGNYSIKSHLIAWPEWGDFPSWEEDSKSIKPNGVKASLYHFSYENLLYRDHDIYMTRLNGSNWNITFEKTDPGEDAIYISFKMYKKYPELGSFDVVLDSINRTFTYVSLFSGHNLSDYGLQNYSKHHGGKLYFTLWGKGDYSIELDSFPVSYLEEKKEEKELITTNESELDKKERSGDTSYLLLIYITIPIYVVLMAATIFNTIFLFKLKKKFIGK